MVEMVVTIFSAIVIFCAILTVLDLSMRESARALDQVEANQHGRTTLERLVQELHSSCVAASVTPVLAGSDSSNVHFLSQFGSAAVLTPNEHVVSFAGGTLTDTAYAVTGGSAPSWTFSSTPTSTTTLGTNLSQALVNGATQPVFQYYAYVNGTLSTTPLPTPLSATDAADTVEVAINFAQGPSDNSNQADRTVNLSDEVVLRFVPATGTTTVPNLPCS